MDTQRFEALLESFQNEIDGLQGSTTSNLQSIHGALYEIFEDALSADVDKTLEDNAVMRQILTDHLSYDDKQYYRIKYALDLGI